MGVRWWGGSGLLIKADQMFEKSHTLLLVNSELIGQDGRGVVAGSGGGGGGGGAVCVGVGGGVGGASPGLTMTKQAV